MLFFLLTLSCLPLVVGIRAQEHLGVGFINLKLSGLLACLGNRRVNGRTQQIALTGLCIAAQPFVVALAMRLRILDHRQPMLHADKIAELPDSFGAAPEVAEFARTVQRSGVSNEMFMLKKD